jgi:hypothetical protein
MSRYKAVWAKSQPQVNPRVLDAWVLDTSDNSTVKRFPAMTLLEAQSAMRLAKRLASSLNRPEPYFAPETRIQPRVEFWEKDGYWHFVDTDGKWSVDGFNSSTDAWKASNSKWEAAQ